MAADFTFREGVAAEADLLEDWDTEACHEAAREVFGESVGLHYVEYFRRGRRFATLDRFWVAENPQGEWAGVIWCRPWSGPGNRTEVAEVVLWFVDPEYRGLGVGSRLLETLREGLGPGPTVMLTTPALERRLDGPLVRSGFQATGRLWFALGVPKDESD